MLLIIIFLSNVKIWVYANNDYVNYCEKKLNPEKKTSNFIPCSINSHLTVIHYNIELFYRLK